jgi:alkylation response protein AidB-like acyl-CoA dehydrogenase
VFCVCLPPALRVVQGRYTVILVPRGENVETKAIRTAYSSTAGTAFVTFDKVRVPVSNTLGKIGKGMQVILSNFNHEVILSPSHRFPGLTR